MSAFLLSVGRWCARHATRVLAAWALLIAALGGVVATTASTPKEARVIARRAAVGITIDDASAPSA